MRYLLRFICAFFPCQFYGFAKLSCLTYHIVFHLYTRIHSCSDMTFEMAVFTVKTNTRLCAFESRRDAFVMPFTRAHIQRWLSGTPHFAPSLICQCKRKYILILWFCWCFSESTSFLAHSYVVALACDMQIMKNNAQILLALVPLSIDRVQYFLFRSLSDRARFRPTTTTTKATKTPVSNRDSSIRKCRYVVMFISIFLFW